MKMELGCINSYERMRIADDGKVSIGERNVYASGLTIEKTTEVSVLEIGKNAIGPLLVNTWVAVKFDLIFKDVQI